MKDAHSAHGPPETKASILLFVLHSMRALSVLLLAYLHDDRGRSDRGVDRWAALTFAAPAILESFEFSPRAPALSCASVTADGACVDLAERNFSLASGLYEPRDTGDTGLVARSSFAGAAFCFETPCLRRSLCRLRRQRDRAARRAGRRALHTSLLFEHARTARPMPQ